MAKPKKIPIIVVSNVLWNYSLAFCPWEVSEYVGWRRRDHQDRDALSQRWADSWHSVSDTLGCEVIQWIVLGSTEMHFVINIGLQYGNL